MTDTLILYGFGLNDRSSKVRWVAHELGIPVQEKRLGVGEHRAAPYTDLNPYGMVPTVQWRGETLIESRAICTLLAETQPERGLAVAPSEPARAAYLQWMSLWTETLEPKLVELVIAKAGIVPAIFEQTAGPAIQHRLPIAVERLPASGFLVADRLTLADVEAGYCLRLGIMAGLLERSAVAGYLEPLMARPAARSSGFFSAIE